MWNSAAFIAAAAVLGLLFILFPLRLQMLSLAITAGLIALPQMLYLGTGSGRALMPRLLHWGYMVDQPTAENVLKYLGFTFGFKWLLIALALIFAGSLQRRFFLAALSLRCRCVFFSVHHRSVCQPEVPAHLGDHRQSVRGLCSLAVCGALSLGGNHAAGKTRRLCSLPASDSGRDH